MSPGHTYAEAGVDIEADDRAIASLSQWLDKTLELRKDNIYAGAKGHYSGLYKLGGGRVLSMSTDSVGTKAIVAHRMKKYDTIGIDLLGMLANDIISVGSTPVAMVDYIGTEKPDPEVLAEMGKGIYEGCRQARVAVIGGETATVPGLISGFDLAGAIVGICGEEELVLGSDIADGDALIGIESKGMHSNGFTLARKVLFGWNDYSLNDPLPTEPSMSIGDALMLPTVIYVETVLGILDEVRPHGLAHITGGGLTKLRRLKRGMGYSVDSTFPLHPVFDAVRRLGKVAWPEMYRTYNMGVGFVVVVDPQDRDRVLAICEKHEMAAKAVGAAFADPEQRVIVRAQEKFVL
jgi:phosphoribosylformylglycinamidine cyclo-ligase